MISLQLIYILINFIDFKINNNNFKIYETQIINF